MDRLKDKVAIVTGSTSGIGTGIAKMFGAEGARVVVCGRNEERGAAVVDAIAEAGGTAWFHKLDITQPETVDALFADTKEKWGSIDVLVNNAAGMALKDGRVDEISLHEQLKAAGCEEREKLAFQKALLHGELPYTIGGGIGQSRICMFFLRKAHIGEIQSSLWPDEVREEAKKAGIPLL